MSNEKLLTAAEIAAYEMDCAVDELPHGMQVQHALELAERAGGDVKPEPPEGNAAVGSSDEGCAVSVPADGEEKLAG